MNEATIFVCADSGFLCSDCVKNEHERIAEVDPECPDDDEWRIIGQQEAADGDECSHCYRVFGEPIDETY